MRKTLALIILLFCIISLCVSRYIYATTIENLINAGLLVGKNTTDSAEVFNDYKNDAGNITIIVDKDGNEIDKSVDENVQVPDRIAPILTGLKVAPTSSNSANVSFNTNEAGTYYYVVLESSQAAPTKRQVLAQAAGEFQGTGGMMEGENSFTLTNLHSAKEYKIYMVIEDNAGNTS